MKEFQWLVNIRLNFLKLKFFGKLNVNYSRILRTYKSRLSDELYWKIFQHNAFLECEIFYSRAFQRKCSEYLQFFANGYFDFDQKGESCKNAARNILNEVNEPWLEKIAYFTNSNYKIASNAVVGHYAKPPKHVELSSDKKLVVCSFPGTAEVFKLPDLTLLVEVKLPPRDSVRKFQIKFSPDSSYFIFNTISSCICISKKMEVPFISYYFASFQSCSFSSCGLKLVTLDIN